MNLRETQQAISLDRERMADWSGRAQRTGQQASTPVTGGIAADLALNVTDLFILGLSELDGSDELA